MTSDIDVVKQELLKAKEDYEQGASLNLHQRVARDIIRSQRSYFYGDRHSNRRISDAKDIITQGFKELNLEASQ